jgi:hypothetical protein
MESLLCFFDNNKLQPITLITSSFTSSYSHILDNVASHKPFAKPLPIALQKALGLPSRTISKYDLERKFGD